MTSPHGAIIRTIAGPDGPIHLAATVRGIVALEQATDVDAFTASLTRRLHVPVELERDVAADDPRRAHLTGAEQAITALARGDHRARAATTVPLDLADRPAWDQRVLAAVAEIGWGETASYGEIARRIGAAGAARAVGGALGRNPITLLIPCHRVIAADGSIGGYGGDGWGSPAAALDRKRALLRREGVNVAVRAG